MAACSDKLSVDPADWVRPVIDAAAIILFDVEGLYPRSQLEARGPMCQTRLNIEHPV